MACAGTPLQYCGAGNRLELYSLAPSPSSTRTSTRTSTSETAVILPFQTWRPKSIEFKDRKDNDDDWPCDMWFFFICIHWPRFNIKAIHLPGPIPPGRYPWPPAPGDIVWPSGIEFHMKPFPRRTITRGTDNKWTTPDPDEEKKTCSQSSTVYDIIVSVTEVVYTMASTTSTSTSTVYSTELPRAGCDLTDIASSTTATTTAAYSFSQYPAPTSSSNHIGSLDEAVIDLATDAKQGISGHNTTTRFTKRDDCNEAPYYYHLLLPKDPFDVAILDDLFLGYLYQDAAGNSRRIPYTKIWAPSHGGFTGGWFFEYIPNELKGQLKAPPLSDKISFFEPIKPDAAAAQAPAPAPAPGPNTPNRKRIPDPDHGDSPRSGMPGESLTVDRLTATRRVPLAVDKRQASYSGDWSLSAISVPPGHIWDSPRFFDPATGGYKYMYHKSAGHGQNVFVVEATVPWKYHTEFAGADLQTVRMAPYGGRTIPDLDMRQDYHVSLVAAAAVGRQLGAAKRATLRAGCFKWMGQVQGIFPPLAMFRLVEVFVNILEQVAREGLGQSSVINLSFGISTVADRTSARYQLMVVATSNVSAKALCELAALGVVIVNSAGNDGNNVVPRDRWPQFLADPDTIDIDLQNIMREVDEPKIFILQDAMRTLVGSTNSFGHVLLSSQMGAWVKVYAPGSGWGLSSPYAARMPDALVPYRVDDVTGEVLLPPLPFRGTSFAAPRVAGLVAYFRGIAAEIPQSLLAEKLTDVLNVWFLIEKLQRPLILDPFTPHAALPGQQMAMIWNGHVPGDPRFNEQDLSCLDPRDVARMSPRQQSWCPQVEDERFWDPDEPWWSDLTPTNPLNSGSGNPGGSGGQSGGDGPDGPGEGGSGITWWAGSPGPQCTPPGSGALPVQQRELGPVVLKGAGRCGLPCDLAWYCDWWPEGLPPFFWDPLDPNNPYHDQHNETYPGSGPVNPGGTWSAPPPPVSTSMSNPPPSSATAPPPPPFSSATPQLPAPTSTSKLPDPTPTPHSPTPTPPTTTSTPRTYTGDGAPSFSPIPPPSTTVSFPDRGPPPVHLSPETCAAAFYGYFWSVETGGIGGGDTYAFAIFQALVMGDPKLMNWTVHCSGELDIKGPYSYQWFHNYGLDTVGKPGHDYLDGTAHAPFSGDIHFKMKSLDPEHLDNNPLDWRYLIRTQFGVGLLGGGSRGYLYAGTNCPDFFFASGHIHNDPGVPHVS